jgi:thiol-disulfide isomerase/thioredoxin
MDRLSSLIVAVSLLLVACDGGGARPEPKSRVVGVAAEKNAFDPASFCEVYAEPDAAKAVRYPDVDPAPSAPKGPRWINVWATWCKPCIEELPRMKSWESRLRDDGVPTEVVLLAADEATAVADFVSAHPEAAGSHVWKDPGALTAWFGKNGLSEASVLPVHLFVDGSDRLRCVRTGGVSADDYDRVAALLRLLAE